MSCDTGWTVRGSNPGGSEIFYTRSDRPWGPLSLLSIGYRVFSGGKTAGAWRWPPTPFSAEVKLRVELYLYSPSGPSWPVLGSTLPYLYTKSRFDFVCHCLIQYVTYCLMQIVTYTLNITLFCPSLQRQCRMLGLLCLVRIVPK